MMIFHTTFHIDHAAYADVVDYLKQEFIPQAVKSGVLSQPAMQRVIQEEEAEGISLGVQFHVEDRATLQRWIEEEGHLLQQAMSSRFGQQTANFSTLLEKIDL